MIIILQTHHNSMNNAADFIHGDLLQKEQKEFMNMLWNNQFQTLFKG